MRVLGAILFLLGGAATAWSVTRSLTDRRPRDVAFALLAPLAVVLALGGLLLLFVPDFFG